MFNLSSAAVTPKAERVVVYSINLLVFFVMLGSLMVYIILHDDRSDKQRNLANITGN